MILPPVVVNATNPCGVYKFVDYASDGSAICATPAGTILGFPGGPSIHGTGGVQGNRGDPKAPSQDDPKPDLCNAAGDPIIFSTGNEIEPETDFVGGGEMPLLLQRTYNHFWNYSGIFGKNWISNFDYSITVNFDGTTTTIWAQRPDGRRIKFLPVSATRWNEDKAQPVAYIIKNADNTYTLHSEDRTTEIYDMHGNPSSIKNERGIGWTFVRSIGGRLDKVTHTSGRSIQFGWTQGPWNRQLIQVTDPAGNIYRYGYSSNNFLNSATMPGSPSTTITYQYEDTNYPDALTGKTINGVRYATIGYSADGRAISSQLAGGVEKYTYTYTGATVWPVADPLPPVPLPDPDWCGPNQHICQEPQLVYPQQQQSVQTSAAVQQLTVVETNPFGKKTTYVFNDGKRVSTTGQASAHCSASYKEQTYDANGYDDLVSDFEDNITDYDYSAAGFPTKITEASGTPSARVTNMAWDPATNRLTSSTVAGNAKTAYTYTTDGRIKTIIVTNLSATGVLNQTHTTTYTYTEQANGLLATMVVDGPLPSDTLTYTYATTTGDLLTIKNSLNQTITYSSYNGLGRPGRVVGINGDITDYVYDARGRVIAVKPTVNGVVQTATTYYDAMGNVALTIDPDGQWLARTYDAAGRMTSTYAPEAGGTYARTRYTLNNLSLPTRIDTERVSGVAMDGPPPATAPTVTTPATNATGSYSVSWTAVSGATRYQFEENTNGGAWSVIQNGSATSKAISGKDDGTYNYRVVACNSIACGSYSATKSTVVTIPVPAAPTLTGPATTQTTRSYTVTWTSVATATSYQLQERTNGGAWSQVYNGAGTSMAFSGKSNNSYGYQVKACSAKGCGAYSAVRTITVDWDPCQTCLTTPPPDKTSSVTKPMPVLAMEGDRS